VRIWTAVIRRPPAPLAPTYRARPYWWDGVALPPGSSGPLPGASDVVVIGSGYTGLGAALELARAGRHVAVVERGTLAEGASSRNGGMVHPGLKHDI
jgi:NADPH-dependent 2,4-dienoyl-CoA reductase/sulfur reductase-like enzyme